MNGAQLILASGSSRRRQLLDQMGLKYRVESAEVDENSRPGEAPASYVCRVASAKARRVSQHNSAGLPVLAADTAVILDGQILGKPGNPDEARDMLERLSGRTHEVLTAVVLLGADGAEHRRLSVSRVTLGTLQADWIAAYCSSAEPLDKAGAYAIQGFAAQWISRLEGSYSGVMGLPLFETMELLREAGVHALPQVKEPLTNDARSTFES